MKTIHWPVLSMMVSLFYRILVNVRPTIDRSLKNITQLQQKWNKKFKSMKILNYYKRARSCDLPSHDRLFVWNPGGKCINFVLFIFSLSAAIKEHQPFCDYSTMNDRNLPTGLSFKKSNIRIWIHQRNMVNLQQVIWEGQGGMLLVEHSNNPKMKKFLEAVPHIMVSKLCNIISYKYH